MNDDYELVVYYIKNGSFSRALLTLDKFLEQNPNDFSALRLKADVLYYQKQYKQSINLCNELLIKYNNNIDILLTKARCYLASEEYDKAISVLEEVLQLESENSDAICILNTAKYKKKKREETLKENKAYLFPFLAFIIFLYVVTYICMDISNCSILVKLFILISFIWIIYTVRSQ